MELMIVPPRPAPLALAATTLLGLGGAPPARAPAALIAVIEAQHGGGPAEVTATWLASGRRSSERPSRTRR